jgi:hypothetical protein
MQSFQELAVCGGLYSLRSHFGSLLDPGALSVTMANISSIGELIKDLASGERFIHDGLDNGFSERDGFASRIDNALGQPQPGEQLRTLRSELNERVDAMAETLRRQQRQIKDNAPALVDAIA